MHKYMLQVKVTGKICSTWIILKGNISRDNSSKVFAKVDSSPKQIKNLWLSWILQMLLQWAIKIATYPALTVKTYERNYICWSFLLNSAHCHCSLAELLVPISPLTTTPKCLSKFVADFLTPTVKWKNYLGHSNI